MSEQNINQQSNEAQTQNPETKFCIECGQKIAKRAVICPHCGCQVEATKESTPNIVINNQNSNENKNSVNYHRGNAKNKWIALLLLWFLGVVGGHKFYEGKIGTGIIYIFTLGFFGIGLIIDFFSLLFKPTTYYV